VRCWAGTDDLELVANAVAEVVALRARREADAAERPEEDVHDAAAKCLGHRPMPELMTQHGQEKNQLGADRVSESRTHVLRLALRGLHDVSDEVD